MTKAICFLCLLFLCACQKPTSKESNHMGNPVVVIQTNRGEIKIELFEDKAPNTVQNFLKYVDEKFYDQLVFHRVIDDFMIQGGGFTKEMKQKKVHEPIRNEANNGIKNVKGTIAMARTSDPHSATAQFFINLVDNDFLNYKQPTSSGYGYCAFGKVISGMDIVETIGKVKTKSVGGYENVPVETIVIEKIDKLK